MNLSISNGKKYVRRKLENYNNVKRIYSMEI